MNLSARSPLLRHTGIALTLVAAATLSACGGDSSGFAAAKVTLNVTTLAGATVSVYTLKTPSLDQQTAPASGVVTFEYTNPTTELNLPATVVTQSLTGYKTCSSVLTLPANISTSVSNCLTSLPTGSYAPVDGFTQARLGNNQGLETSTINSGLTLTAVGVSQAVNLGAVKLSEAGVNTKFTVNMQARGLEGLSCANKFTLYQVEAAPLLVLSGATLGNSAANGGFSTVTMSVDKTLVTDNTDIFVKFEAGSCGSLATDDQADDFEVTDVLGQFTS
jgi:hypothetical protein